MIKFSNTVVNNLKSTVDRLNGELDDASSELTRAENEAHDELRTLLSNRRVKARVVTRSYAVVGDVTYSSIVDAIDVEGMENYISVADVVSIEEE
jgi:hypothetical protein